MIPIICPRCGSTLPIGNILQDQKTGKARCRCTQCRNHFQISPPLIRKKLIYLDQSFLSAVCLEFDSPKSQNEVRILSKIKELKVQQKIALIVSDVHSRETSAIPDEYDGDRKKLWQFQNDLADGNIADDCDAIFIAQQRRFLTNQDSSDFFPVTDIGINDPHQMQIGMRIQLTNQWRPKLHREFALPRNTVNEEFCGIFEQQLENMPDCKDVRDCLDYVRGLWQKDIRQGIVCWRQKRDIHKQMEQIVNEIKEGRSPIIPQLENPSPFCRVVGEIVQGLDDQPILQRWMKLIEGDTDNLCAFIRIRSVFEGALLWELKTEGAPTNPKKFHTKFGQSCQNDIDHIASYAPYVDALTTDNNMRHFCENDIVADELKQFSCKIFSKNNYNEFENWLDILLTDPVSQ